jgi:hypothetical protein
MDTGGRFNCNMEHRMVPRLMLAPCDDIGQIRLVSVEKHCINEADSHKFLPEAQLESR